MNRDLTHTPYDGSHPLFRIGLEPLDLAHWLEVDEKLDFYLGEKERLRGLYPSAVFAAERGSEAAQGEVQDLILEHLQTFHQDTHEVRPGTVKIDQRVVNLDGEEPPLLAAAKLVQEDLILMRKGAGGWRLIAASLCFPSSWSLKEKFQKPIGEIHGPVPGFASGSRNASLIERIFDNLPVEKPVRRMNWSVYSDNELFHDDKVSEDLRKQDFYAGIFMRVEHQTLRKLTKSGDILFTVRIHVDPFEKLAAHPRSSQICAGFVNSLEMLDDEQLAYKGLTQSKDRLIASLRALMAEAGEMA